jgi:hypothetical protein
MEPLARKDNQLLAKQQTGWTVAIELLAAGFLAAGCAGVLFVNPLNGFSNEDIGRAKYDVKSIEKAIMVYKGKHLTYHADLETLTISDENEATLLNERFLYDPWKQHYIYNPGVRHPKTNIPRVYSNGPPDAPRMVSNWDPER